MEERQKMMRQRTRELIVGMATWNQMIVVHLTCTPFFSTPYTYAGTGAGGVTPPEDTHMDDSVLCVGPLRGGADAVYGGGDGRVVRSDVGTRVNGVLRVAKIGGTGR